MVKFERKYVFFVFCANLAISDLTTEVKFETGDADVCQKLQHYLDERAGSHGGSFKDPSKQKNAGTHSLSSLHL